MLSAQLVVYTHTFIHSSSRYTMTVYSLHILM